MGVDEHLFVDVHKELVEIADGFEVLVVVIIVLVVKRGAGGQALQDALGDIAAGFPAAGHPAPAATGSLCAQYAVEVGFHTRPHALPLLGRESVEEDGEVVYIDAVGKVDVARHEEAFEMGQCLDGVLYGVGGEGEGGAVARCGRGQGDVEGADYLFPVHAAGDVDEVAGGDALAVGEDGQLALLAVAEVSARGGGFISIDLVVGHMPVGRDGDTGRGDRTGTGRDG